MEENKIPSPLPNVEKLKERTELYKLWAALIGFLSQIVRLFV